MSKELDFQTQLDNLTKSISVNRIVHRVVNYNMDRSFRIVEAIGKGFNPDFDITIHEENYKEMIRYYMRDSKFNGNLFSGLLLRGKPGTGKTLAFYIFQQFLITMGISKPMNEDKNSLAYSITRCLEIKSQYESEEKNSGGENALKKFKRSNKICTFDDLGEEIKDGKLAVHYSSECNVMENILTARYDNYLKYGTLTNATTNYMFENKTSQKKYFREFYGVRVEDRMDEMFNEIIFNGESLRKKHGGN